MIKQICSVTYRNKKNQDVNSCDHTGVGIQEINSVTYRNRIKKLPLNHTRMCVAKLTANAGWFCGRERAYPYRRAGRLARDAPHSPQGTSKFWFNDVMDLPRVRTSILR